MSAELGIHVCGGRGKHSRATPSELLAIGERVGLDGADLGRSSRLVAKVDSAAVQDGFDLYLHGFIVSDDGKWTVVQQGMNGDRRQARRYHWVSDGLTSFVDASHAAIEGAGQGTIVNLSDKRADNSLAAQLYLLGTIGPGGILRELARRSPKKTEPEPQASLPHLILPDHHDVRSDDVVERRLHGTLVAAADRAPKGFADLLLIPGLGARTLHALAMVAEVVHGAPCRFSDPARFSLAHGGKDQHPYLVPTKVYDHTIAVMRKAVENARLGREEGLAPIRRLNEQVRRLEATATGRSLDSFIADERERSHEYGGRTVFGFEPAPGAKRTDARV